MVGCVSHGLFLLPASFRPLPRFRPASQPGPIPLHQSGKFGRRERQGRHGTTGKARWPGSRTRARLEDLSVYPCGARRDARIGPRRRPRRDPADLDDSDRTLAPFHPAHLLGGRRAGLGGVPDRAAAMQRTNAQPLPHQFKLAPVDAAELALSGEAIDLSRPPSAPISP